MSRVTQRSFRNKVRDLAMQQPLKHTHLDGFCQGGGSFIVDFSEGQIKCAESLVFLK